MSVNANNVYDMDAAIAEFYDLTETGTDDVDTLLRLVDGRSGLRILEPFCGTGRILLALAHAGHAVVGLDQSEVLLGRCRTKLASLPVDTQRRVDLIQADATAGNWPTGFDVVVLGGNWAYELATAEEQQACIAAAGQALTPGGHLFSDTDHMEGELDEAWQRRDGVKPCWPTGELTDGTKLDGWNETVWTDPAARLWRCRRGVKITFPDGTMRESVRSQQKHPVSGEELQAWMAAHGLVVEWHCGQHGTDRPYTPDAPRATFWARLAARFCCP